MEFGQYPDGSVPEKLFDEATLEMSNYAVLLAVNGRSSGSGTLVTVDGGNGILTAAHVIDDVMRTECETLELVISADLHRLSLEKRFLIIDRHGPGAGESDGPDLGFIHINDPGKVGTLKAKKSFYPLKPDVMTVFDAIEFKGAAVCFLAGAPIEIESEEGIRKTPSHVLRRTLFFGRTQVTKQWTANGFDYLDCEMFAGQNGFPGNYGGVSGGGIWHVPLRVDPEAGSSSFECLPLELVGVAFYQSELSDHSRVIRAHGHHSFYPTFAAKTSFK